MRGPNYSRGILVTSLLDATSLQNFFNDVHDALLLSQWTVVKQIPSPSGGTHGYQFKSVATPGGTQILLSVYWDGSTMVLFGYPIVKFYIDTLDETHTTLAGTVTIQANKTNRIICGPYQFFVFYDYTVSTDPNLDGPFNRNNATGGIPVRKIDSGDAFWTLGDTNSWRYDLYRDQTGTGNLGFLINSLWKTGRNPGIVINPTLLSLRGSQLLNPTAFVDLNYPVINPMLVLGTQTENYVLSLWDAIVVGAHFSAKITLNADFRDWESFTTQSSSSTNVGCLFLATKSYASRGVGSYAH